MNIFRPVLFFASLFFLASIGFAQPNKADKILNESRKKFKAASGITADISYTLKNPNLDDPIVKKGSVSFKKEMYMISFKEEEMYCDGKKVWVHLKDDEEVTVTAYDPEENLSVERIYKIYDQQSKTKYEGIEAGAHKLTAFLTEENDIWKVELWIGTDSKMVLKAIMHGKNGSTYTYRLTNINSKAILDDSIFTFDKKKYPDVYINDLQ